MALNDMICRSAKGKSKAYKLFDGDGLYLLIKANSTKCWRLKYRLGKEKVLAIGTYPEVSLAEAREEAIEARKLIKKGGLTHQILKNTKENLPLLRLKIALNRLLGSGIAII